MKARHHPQARPGPHPHWTALLLFSQSSMNGLRQRIPALAPAPGAGACVLVEPLALPPMCIAYTSLTALVPAPPAAEGLPSIFANASRALRRRAPAPPLRAIDAITGVFLPARSCAIIAAPGSGTSTLLALLAGRLPPSSPPSSLLFNGATPAQLAHGGVNVRRLVAHCGEADVDLEALLTVKETLTLVAAARGMPHGGAAVAAAASARAHRAMDVLGLLECASTRVGSAAVRGISGGQRRRVMIGEAVLCGARALMLDSPTSGLDAVTSFSILQQLTQWALQSRGILVAALQAPSQELLALFDDVILLSDGKELFHGPVTSLEPYLASIGFLRPPSLTLPELASEVAVDPSHAATLCSGGGHGEGDSNAWSSVREEAIEELCLIWRGTAAYRTLCSATLEASGASGAAPAEGGGSGGSSDGGLSAATHLRVVARCAAADAAAATVTAAAAATTVAPPSLLGYDIIRARFGLGFSAGSILDQVRLMLPIRGLTLARNKSLITARYVNSCVMGVILATLASGATVSDFPLRFGLGLFACVFIGFSNNAEVPLFALSRGVTYRHGLRGAALYSPLAMVASTLLCSLPVVLTADFVFTSLVYWVTGWDHAFSRFAVFYTTLVLLDLVMGAYLRSMAVAFSTLELSNIVGIAIVSIMLSSSGFFVIRSSMPVWIAWVSYINPFYWAIVSISCNEFLSPRYATPISNAPGALSEGASYSAAYNFPHSQTAMWGGIAFLACAWLILGWGLTTLLLTYVYYPPAHGTRRRPAADSASAIATAAAAAAPVGVLPVAQHNSTPFPRVALACRDVTFSVRVPATLPPSAHWWQRFRPTPTTERFLLRGVTCFALPGTLTALMGATGAGKSTLLDVLACRKDTGEGLTGGTIAVNGKAASRNLLGSVATYAQQADVHFPNATVREALEFSHTLRASPTSPVASRATISRLLALLELDGPLEQRLVGTLARGELKRLTLGVELASSSASLVFADEPTTNLDARSASIIMRVLQRVAATGCTVVCTVHQPSRDVFASFSHLLLLAPGGHVAFTGPISELKRHFESIPNAPPLLPSDNPAVWMLQVLRVDPGVVGEGGGAPTADGGGNGEFNLGERYAAWWSSSALARSNTACVSRLLGAPLVVEGEEAYVVLSMRGVARAWPQQLRLLMRRSIDDKWRAEGTVAAVLLTSAALGLLFGVLLLNNDASTYAGTVSTLGFGLSGCAFAAIVFLQTSIATEFQRKPAFLRERAARMYGASGYSITIFATAVPYVIAAAFIFVSISYWMAHLRADASAFFFFCLCAAVLVSGKGGGDVPLRCMRHSTTLAFTPPTLLPLIGLLLCGCGCLVGCSHPYPRNRADRRRLDHLNLILDGRSLHKPRFNATLLAGALLRSAHNAHSPRHWHVAVLL